MAGIALKKARELLTRQATVGRSSSTELLLVGSGSGTSSNSVDEDQPKPWTHSSVGFGSSYYVREFELNRV